MQHLMLDLETLGLTPGCVVTQIGACVFDLSTGIISDTFTATLEYGTQITAGATVDAATLAWWFNQVREGGPSQNNFTTDANVLTVHALHDFNQFWSRYANEKKPKDLRIWAKGPSFDCSILAALYRMMGMREPWEFWQERDVRTFFDMFSDAYVKADNPFKHCAVRDAIAQAQEMMAISKQLNAIKVQL